MRKLDAVRQGFAPFVLALILVGHTVGASAEPDPIHPRCNGHVRAFLDDQTYVEKGFNFKRQKGWYHRWWSGSCNKVPYPDRWTCTTSKGSAKEGTNNRIKAWFVMVDRFTTGAGGDEPEVAEAMCQLGELIGLEWARDNDVRCIHTSDLTALSRHLEDDEKGPRLRRIADVRVRATTIIEDCRKAMQQRLEARRRK